MSRADMGYKYSADFSEMWSWVNPQYANLSPKLILMLLYYVSIGRTCSDFS
jgi:hypothetical protein